MFGLDAFHLARIQFFTVSFHIFPAITISLAGYLAVLEGLWLKTKNPVWRSLYAFPGRRSSPSALGWAWFSGLVIAYRLALTGVGFRSSRAVLPAPC